MSRKTWVFVAVLVLSLGLDQATKYWVFHHVVEGVDEIKLVPGFLSIIHAQNPGAAIGLLRDFQYRYWVFFGFTMVAVGVILDLWRRLPPKDAFLSTTLGLILAGAVGNAIDRVVRGTVTDFIRVYTESPSLKGWLVRNFSTNEWPTFNIADSTLVVGVLLFLVHYLFLEDEKPKAPTEKKA